MIDIFLDSSVLRGLKPRGLEAHVLRQLVEVGAIKVHVSTIVEREVATGFVDDIKLTFGSVGWATDRAHKRLESAVELIRNAGPIIAAGVKQWLDTIKAERHSPSAQETRRVLTDTLRTSHRSRR